MTEQPTTNTAIAPYKQLKQLMTTEEIKARFSEILGQRAGGFMASVLNTVYLNNNLRECDPNTVIISALTAAALDMPIDPNIGFAYIIPYKGRAAFQIGYKGFIQLALRSGQYSDINVTEVYTGEQITVNRLTGRVNLNGHRTGDDVIGYVSYFRLLNGFEKYLYMSNEEIDAHAAKYSKTYDNPRGLWKTNFPAMAKKTVLKALISKFGIMSVQMQGVMRQEAEVEDAPIPFPAHDVIDGTLTETIDPAAVLVETGCDNLQHARNIIKYVPEELLTNREGLVHWYELYTGWRNVGKTTEEAAALATDGELPA